jgi:hypothetical protein
MVWMRRLSTFLGCAVALAGALALIGAGGGARAAGPTVDRFDSAAAWDLLREQVEIGPRPAGSAASLTLARRLRALLPQGHFERVPGGLRNVVGVVPGRTRRVVVVGAHYDTKDIEGFVGANDGASGTAVVTQLARTIPPRRLRKTVVFILFDGEESPRGTPDRRFEVEGLRGSKIAAQRHRRAEAMILLDFVCARPPSGSARRARSRRGARARSRTITCRSCGAGSRRST